MIAYETYIDHVEEESRRFRSAAGVTTLDAAVPSCPGWSVADLVWHLCEVQSFWASIVQGLLTDPDEVVRLERPADEELLDLFERESASLIAALRTRPPDATCWSWTPSGSTTGWVARRQAHEALIHRLDAELAAGVLGPIDGTLAADGVDEAVRVMIGGVPDWGEFTPDGTSVLLAVTGPESGTADAWALELGRFTGTSPTSGTTYDLAAAEVLEVAPGEPDAVISGPAPALDAWLWGRAPIDELTLDGDPAVVTRLRELAAEAMQ